MQHCWQQCFCVLAHGSLILGSLILLFLSDRFTSLHTFKITFFRLAMERFKSTERPKDRKTATVLFQSKKEKEIFCARLLPTMMMFKFKRNTGKRYLCSFELFLNTGLSRPLFGFIFPFSRSNVSLKFSQQ